jgi:2-polyprenyl-6-methoxyphenol hydroxylase-like FAD-dependent oxidoreductase
MDLAIVGGGICGLSLALSKKERGIACRVIACRVYERTPGIKLVGDEPFDNLDKYVTQNELRALSENYKRTVGFGWRM